MLEVDLRRYIESQEGCAVIVCDEHAASKGREQMGVRFHLADKIRCDAPPTLLGIGSDDRTVVFVGDDKLWRVDLKDRSQVALSELPKPANDLAMNLDHKRVAVAAGASDVAIYHLETGAHLQSMSRDGAPGSLKNVAANHIAMAPDGKTLVTTTSGSRIFVSNIESGQWEHIMFVKYNGCDVSISPNGQYVALFGAPKASELSGHVTMFRVHRGLQPLWTRWHESAEAVTSCRFSPDSKTLTTCGAEDGARVWDTAKGDLLWIWKSPNKKKLHAAWNFGEKDVLAILEDELMIVQKGLDVPIFRKKMTAPESRFEISQSGKLVIRVEDKQTLAIWKLNHPQSS